VDNNELQEIKARSKEIKRLLGDSVYAQTLIENDVPKLVAEVKKLKAKIEEQRIELEYAGKCVHGNFYRDRDCINCFGDGTEKKQECSECGHQTWHRGGKCLSHDMNVTRPYELSKAEQEHLRDNVKYLKEELSARIREAEERLRGVETSRAIMQEVLEHMWERLTSFNINESLHKIDSALSTLALSNPPKEMKTIPTENTVRINGSRLPANT
jgi:hypothetical protein